MKTGRLFWGIFFIAIGVLILFNNLDLLNIEWGEFWKFWPLVLIGWGLSILSRKTNVAWIFAVISGILLALVLFAFVQGTKAFVSNIVPKGKAKVEFYEEKYDSTTKEVSLYLDAGAGTFIISDTTDLLLTAETKGTKNLISIEREKTGESEKVKIKLKEKSVFWDDGFVSSRTEFKLNPNPVWDINVDIGASSTDFDFSQIKLRNADIDIGASSSVFKFGDLYHKTDIKMNAGVSSVKISIPENSYCELFVDAAISGKHIDGFIDRGNGRYVTDNIDKAENSIYINLDSGVSSLHINRY